MATNLELPTSEYKKLSKEEQNHRSGDNLEGYQRVGGEGGDWGKMRRD